jgi:hypothetical protein
MSRRISAKKAAEWTGLARTTGLTASRTLEGFGEDDSFRQNQARIGGVEHGALDSTHVLRGMRNGHAFMLWQYSTEPKLSEIFEGDPEGSETVVWWTAVVMPLEPPLAFGLHVARARAGSNFLHGDDQRIGHGPTDDALRIQSLDSAKLRSLLSPRSDDDAQFLAALCRGAADQLVVTDSMLRFRLVGRVSHAARLMRFVDAASWFRAQLEARIPRVVVQPYEVALRQEWQRAATTVGLTFEPGPMRLRGIVEGIPLEIAVDSAPMRLRTAITVTWPQPLAAAVEVSKLPPAPGGHQDSAMGRALHRWTYGLVHEDVVVGDRVFDDVFVIRGAREAARALLAPPLLRQNLVAIATRSEAVYLTPYGLSWFVKAPLAQASDLAGHVKMAVQTAHTLFPPRNASYR